MTQRPMSLKANIVVQTLETEVLIYDLDRNKAFCLNQTSALVFELCDGTRTVGQISDEMSKRLKTLVSEEMVWVALDLLGKDGLIENATEFTANFAGLSRREAIKKAGLASMVALPVITALTAPQAAHAQSSGCAVTGVCLPANTDVCAGCPPLSNVIVDQFASDDGACTGLLTSVIVTCNGNPQSPPRDTRITGVILP